MLTIRSCRVVLSGLLLAGLALAARPVLAQSGATVRLLPLPASVGEGQTAAVEVRIENVTNLYGFDIRLSFDPAAVEVVDADPNTPGVQVRPGSLLKADFVVKNVVDNVQGTVWFAMTQISPTPEVTGSGSAFTLTFKGKQRGGTSPLKVTYAVPASRAGEKIAVAIQDGEIRVVDLSQAPASPTPAPVVPTAVLPTALPTLPAPTPPVPPTVAPTATPPAPPTAVPTATQPVAPTVTPMATAVPAVTAVTPVASAVATQVPPTAQPTATAAPPASAATAAGAGAIQATPVAPPDGQGSPLAGGPLVVLGAGIVLVAAYPAYRIWNAWRARRRLA